MKKLSFFYTSFQDSFEDVVYFRMKASDKVLKIYKSIVIENFKPVPLSPIKWRPFKLLVKLHKSAILIADIAKGAVSDLRQFLPLSP